MLAARPAKVVSERGGWNFNIGGYKNVPEINTKEDCMAAVVNNGLKFGMFRTEKHSSEHMRNTCMIQKDPSDFKIDKFNAALNSNLNDPAHVTFLVR